jgi:C1A family cysteine protease
MKLKHFPERNILCETVSEQFLIDNDMPSDMEISDAQSLMIPPAFSIRESMSAVQDQGGAGTCTSFGVLSNLEYKHGRIDLSEACVTHETEKKYGDCKEGLAIPQVYVICRDNGVVAEQAWPYDDTKICWNPAPNTAGRPRYKFSQVQRVFSRPSKMVIENMRIELHRGRSEFLVQPQNFVRLTKAALHTNSKPVTISIPVWFRSDGHFDAGWENGVIKMPTPVNLQLWLEKNGVDLGIDGPVDMDLKSPPNVSGWHAVSICGYNDTTGRFTFKNSWSEWWGDDGYGTIPYNYITAYAREGFIGI